MFLRSVFFLLIFSVSAVAAGPALTYHGRLLRSDGTPITSSVQIKVQIYSPGSESCLLYEEVQTQDLSTTAGVFAIGINDGTGTRTDGGTSTFGDIFSNRVAMNFAAGACAVGTTYTPTATDSRVMKVSFNDGVNGWDSTPTQAINFVPKAVDAMQVAGFPATSLLRVQEASGALDSVSPLNNAQYTELLALVGGTSTQYQKAGDLNGAAVPPMTTGQVLGWNGTTWTSVDPLASVQTFAKTPLPTCGANQFLKDNGSGGLVCVAAINTGGTVTTVATGTGLTGGPITTSGSISIAPGGVSSTELALNAVSTANIADAAITGAKLAANIGIVTSGNISATNLSANGITGQNIYLYEPTNTYKVGLAVPSALATNYSLNLPLVGGTSGQVMVSDGSGNLTWVSRLTGVVQSVSGTSPIVVGGTAASPTISVGTASTATAGVVTLAADGDSTALKVVQGSDSRLSNSRTPTGPATGDLSGAYPSPKVAALQGVSIQTLTPFDSQFLRYSSAGTSWLPAYANFADLKSAAGLSQIPNSCTVSQTMTWSAVSDTFSCSNIAIASSAVSGLGGAALLNIGSLAGTVAAGNDSRITGAVQNAGSTVSLQSGLDGSRPSAGTNGAVYFATDTQRIYRDNGAAWVQIASNSGSGGTITGVSSGTGLAGSGVSGVVTLTLANTAVTAGSYGSATTVATFTVDAQGRLASAGNTTITPAGFTGTLSGDVTGTQGATVVTSVGSSTAANVHSAELLANAATSANTASTIVKRDASGNFTAGGISASTFTASTSYILKDTGANIATLQAPANLASSYSLTLPVVTPITGQVLASDAAGNLTWVSASIGSVTNVSAGTGLNGGSISTSGTISLANTAVTAGSFGSATQVANFTVDAQGRLTNAGNITISGVAPGGNAGGDLTGTYPSPTLTLTGVTAGSYGSGTQVPVLTFDSKGRVTLATTATVTSAGFTGNLAGDVTGTQGATVVTTVGASSAANVHTAELLANAATSTNSASTIVKRDSSGNFAAAGITGTTFTASTAYILKDTGANTATLQAPTNITTSYVLKLPVLTPTPGQVLASDASGNMSWVSAAVGSVTNIATGTGLTGGPISSTGTISLANTAVTAGSFGSATQVANFTVDAQGRLTNAGNITISGVAPGGNAGGDLTGTYPNPTLTLTGVTAGSYGSGTQVPVLTVDSKGRVTLATTATVTSAGFTGNLSGDVTGAQGATVVTTVGTSTAANIHAGELLANAATSANTASTIVKRDSSGNFAGAAITGTTFTASTSYILKDTGANTATLQAPTNITTSYVLKLPVLTPTAGQVLASDAFGNMSWVSAAVGSVTSITTGTGLTGGPISSAGTISLANTAVTAGSFGSATQVANFTVDAQGRLTNAGNITISGVVPGGNAGGDLTGTYPNPTLALTGVTSGSYGSGTQVPVLTLDSKGRVTVASTATVTSAGFTGSLVGDVTGTQGATVVTTVGASSAANIHSAELLANAATSANTTGTIVKRDSSGNFAAAGISGTTFTASTSYILKDSGLNTVTLQAPTNFVASYVLKLPVQAPASGQVLASDSSGNMTWVSATAGSVTNIATGTGLSGGPINSTGTISLANTAVTAGTFGSATQVANFTVDAQGRLTNAGNTTISGVSPGGSASGDLTGTYPSPTLVLTGVTSGTYGSGTQVPVLTLDSKGRVTLAATATVTSAGFSGNLAGDVTGTQSATVVSSVGTSTAANIHLAELLANAATNTNTASTIVRRDSSGNFAAGQITATSVGIGTSVPGAKLEVAGSVRMDGGTSGYVGFQAPAMASGNLIWTLPATDGSSGQQLATNGSGSLSWATPASGTVTGTGTTNYYSKFTAAGAIGSALIYDNGTNIGIGTASPSSLLSINGLTTVTNGTNKYTIGGTVSNTTTDNVEVKDLVGSGGYSQFGFWGATTGTATYFVTRQSTSTSRFFYGIDATGGGRIENEGGDTAIYSGTYPGTDRLHVQSATGNVGISASNPGAKLEVAGAVRMDGGTSGYVGFQAPSVASGNLIWTLPAGDGGAGQVLATSGSGVLSWVTALTSGATQWSTSGSNIFYSAGNVGIGTTSPQSALHVATGQIFAANGTVTAPSYSFAGSPGSGFYIPGTNDFRIANNGSDRLRSAGGVIYIPGTLSVGDESSVPLSSAGITGNISVGATYSTVAAPTNGAIFQGNVGIGTTSPSAALHVVGQMVSAPYNNGASTTFNLNNGNAQYTSASCGAMTLNNMVDGASYTIAVQGATSGTCTFTDSGGSRTFRFSPANAATTASSHTVYSMQVLGSYVYVSWITGF